MNIIRQGVISLNTNNYCIGIWKPLNIVSIIVLIEYCKQYDNGHLQDKLLYMAVLIKEEVWWHSFALLKSTS